MRRTTTKRARTWRYRRMLLNIGRSSETELLSPYPFCRVFIIDTRGYDFRKGQVVIRSALNVAEVPIGEIGRLFDRLVCAEQQRLRHGEAERLPRFQSAQYRTIIRVTSVFHPGNSWV